MKICTIGTGYVGLVSAACLASIGHDLIAVDIDEDKISMLQSGKVPIYEPGLEKVISQATSLGRLQFSADVSEGVTASDVIFITVGTPSDHNGAADMSAVKAVAVSLAKSMDRYKVIVDKSTMPVGSSKLVAKIIQENQPNPLEYDVVSNPEFLREGSAVEDFLHPDRIVIGTDSERAAGVMSELYSPIRAPLMITDPASAEMIKYASNCFLATKVSFINAIANICSSVNADVKEVALGMGYDRRIGFEFLRAGPGFGGSCFPKDSRAMLTIAKENGYDFQLLQGVLDVNTKQQSIIVDWINKLLGKKSRVGIVGLAFKPNTDDMRDSPAINIITGLQANGHEIVAYDPVAAANAKKYLKNITYAAGPYEVAKGSDIIVLVTEWEEFKYLDWRKIKNLLNKPIIFDTRNCLDPQTLRRIGFTYQGIGR